MQKLEFIVQIPAVLSAITGFETKKFDGENPQKNKKKALKYLSEVIIGCVKQKCIEIFEIDDEANLSQVGNLKQEKFLNEDGVLKFPKLNIIDRFRFDSVVDFLDFYINSYHWPAFNIADAAICTGVGLYLLASLFPAITGLAGADDAEKPDK